MLDGLTIHSFCRSFSHFSKSDSNLAANVRRYFGDWLTTGAAHWFGRFLSWTKFIAKCTDWNECSTIRLIYMCVSGARRPGGRSLLLISDLNCEKKKKINLILWRDRRCDAIHGYREFISHFFSVQNLHYCGRTALGQSMTANWTEREVLTYGNWISWYRRNQKENWIHTTKPQSSKLKWNISTDTLSHSQLNKTISVPIWSCDFFFSFLLSSFCR